MGRKRVIPCPVGFEECRIVHYGGEQGWECPQQKCGEELCNNRVLEKRLKTSLLLIKKIILMHPEQTSYLFVFWGNESTLTFCESHKFLTNTLTFIINKTEIIPDSSRSSNGKMYWISIIAHCLDYMLTNLLAGQLIRAFWNQGLMIILFGFIVRGQASLDMTTSLMQFVVTQDPASLLDWTQLVTFTPFPPTHFGCRFGAGA